MAVDYDDLHVGMKAAQLAPAVTMLLVTHSYLQHVQSTLLKILLIIRLGS